MAAKSWKKPSWAVNHPATSGYKKQALANMKVAAASTKNLGNTRSNRNTGGGGGRVAAPVSTLAGLPQTPELAALLQSGMIREGMAPEQALAIMASNKLSGQVPIDIAALKAMVAGDYASSLQGVTGPAQQWMQQLMGANAPQPGDPMYDAYMADPIFSQYAGGLQQMQETANTNLASDQAWFDKQQQAMTDYYNGLMASIGSAAPVGSGGGGGGGGGRGYGGGGGGSGGSGDNPYGFGDAKTTASSEQVVKDQSQTTLDEMNPDYWQSTLSGLAEFAAGTDAAGNTLSPEDQAIINEYGNLLTTGQHGDPNAIMEQIVKDWEADKGIDLAQENIAEGNTNFDAAQSPQLNAELARYLQAYGYELGDDPTTAALETYHQAVDANGDPVAPGADMMNVANQEALAPIQAKLDQIFAPTNAPGAGLGFGPASAVLNKIFNYVGSNMNQDPQAAWQNIQNYSGPRSTLNFNKGGLGGGTPTPIAAPTTDPPPVGSIDEVIQQQLPTPTPPVNLNAQGAQATTANIQNVIASQRPGATTTPENQIIYDAGLPVANLDPTTGLPPEDESNGIVWGPGGIPVPADYAAQEAAPQSSSFWEAALGRVLGTKPQPQPSAFDIANIKNVIASQMPPSTGLPAGSIPGSPANPTTIGPGGIPMNAPTTTPTGIPIGTQSAPSFDETYQNAGNADWLASLAKNRVGQSWNPSRMGGWNIPQSVKDSILGPGPQSTAEQAATIVANNPGPGITGAAGGGGPMVPRPSEIVPKLMPGLAGAGDSAKEQIFSQPSRTLPALNEQDLANVFNDPYVAPTTSTASTGASGFSPLMPRNTILGFPSLLPTGNKEAPVAPLPQPDPNQLAQLAQSVLGGKKVPGIPFASQHVPQTAASMFQNLSTQGIPYADAVNQLLADSYGGDPEAAYQEWLASGAAPESGTAVGDDRMVTPTNVVNKWQNSRFNPQTGMISEEVMNSLRASSLPDFIASHPGVNAEVLNQMDPGQFWRTPEDPADASARALHQIAREFILGKSRLASTYWNPAIYKNREQQTVTNTDKLGSTAKSYLPEAAALTTLNLQDPQLIEPDDSLSIPGQSQIMDDTEVVGFRNPATRAFTKPPAPVMDNINNFVGNLSGSNSVKRTANPLLAIKSAAKNKLQAKQATGKMALGLGSLAAGLGGKYRKF